MGNVPEHIRKVVLKRDQYRCQNDDCRRTEVQRPGLDLQVHHIKPEKWGGSDERQNLVTVCNACHWMLHKKEGDAENGRLELSMIGKPRSLRSEVYRKEDLDLSGCRGAIVEVLSDQGTMQLKEIIDETGYSQHAVSTQLNGLRIAGHVKKVRRGVYSYVTTEEVEQNIREMRMVTES